MMKKLTDFIKKTITAIFVLYMIAAVVVFAPLYNWRYARQYGFWRWLWLGEIVSTVKSIGWPYYTFYVQDSNKNYADKISRPELNEQEKSTIRAIVLKARYEMLGPEDYRDFKRAFRKYQKRTGVKFNREEGMMFTMVLDRLYKYRLEKGRSLLISIDKKEPVFTNEYYDACRNLREIGLIKNSMLDNDKKLVISAARRQEYVDPDGIRHYPVTKEQVVKVMKSDEIMKINSDGLKKAFNELIE